MGNEAQNALLQKIAAAAVPHKLGLLYSRYGAPAPVLGGERAPVLGRDRATAPYAGGLRGRPESRQVDDEDARLAKYAELPDPEDLAAADAEQDRPASEMRGTLVDAYPDTPGLEDLMDNEPGLTVRDVQHYAADAKSGIGWEDWLGQYQDEKASGDPRAGTRP